MKSTIILQNEVVALAPASESAARYCALGAVAGPILGTLMSVILGLMRSGYSSINQTVSELGVGPNGWLMDIAFAFEGILTAAGVIAVFHLLKNHMGIKTRLACILLLIISPLGLVWLGIFTVRRFALHLMGAQAAFDVPIVSFLIAGFILRRVPGWRRFGMWMMAGSPLTLALLIGFLSSIPTSQLATGGAYLGIWQRALAIEILGWYAALGWLASRRKWT